MGKFYMLTVIVWIVIAIIASATSAARGANDVRGQALPTLTMSATWAVATPTPHVAAPGVYRVWLPVVMGGGG